MKEENRINEMTASSENACMSYQEYINIKSRGSSRNLETSESCDNLMKQKLDNDQFERENPNLLMPYSAPQ